MKNFLALSILALLFSCNSSNTTSNDNAAKDAASQATNGASNTTATNTTSDYKKYDIKSGIVTYQTTMTMGSMVIKTTKVVYFDDYGNKEASETFSADADGKDVLTDRVFVKDGYHYNCSVENGSGIKTKAMGYGIEAQYNSEDAAKQTDNKYKSLSDQTICNKPCTGFSVVTPSGNTTMYGWSHITLKITVDNPSMKIKTETVATKLEENATIPADKFEVPAGVKMTDM